MSLYTPYQATNFDTQVRLSVDDDDWWDRQTLWIDLPQLRNESMLANFQEVGWAVLTDY